jgi:hypothetical protein
MLCSGAENGTNDRRQGGRTDDAWAHLRVKHPRLVLPYGSNVALTVARQGLRELGRYDVPESSEGESAGEGPCQVTKPARSL